MHHKHSNSDVLRGGGEDVPGTRAGTMGIFGVTRCSIVVQAGAALTRAVLGAFASLAQKRMRNVSIRAIASRSNEETVELIGTLRQQSDALALLAKNTASVHSALCDLRAAGKPVMALLSDLDANARSTYIGADNRAAGQLAGLFPCRPLHVTHEFDESTEPLLRAGAIDFLIAENLQSIVSAAKHVLIGLKTGVVQNGEVKLVPIELISKFNLEVRAPA